MKLLIGSSNPHKIREYRELLAGLDVELVEPSGIPEPEESADSFAENAVHKARAYAAASGMPAVADDSGLEVRALGGAPGVHSRRFFGGDAVDDADERNRRLLALMDGVKDRGARFVCVCALAYPDGAVETFEGEVAGVIAPAPRGEHNFGYDPLFVVDGLGRTMAELDASEKHAVSHRGRAAARLRTRLAAPRR